MAINKKIPKPIKVRFIKEPVSSCSHYAIETKNHNRIDIFVYGDSDNIFINGRIYLKE